MLRPRVVKLIAVNPEATGVGIETAELIRKVYGTLKSVGMQEAYQAMGQGLNPEIKVILPHAFEYKGEGLCEMSDVRYRILRTYVTEADSIELTLQRVNGNARPLPDPEVDDNAD